MRDALEALEFGRIRQAVAERASTLWGQEAALLLMPKESLEAARNQQDTIAEAIAHPYRLGGIRDFRESLGAARAGKRLSGLELLEAATSLDSAAELKRGLLDSGEKLGALAANIGEHTLFRRRVGECLNEAGELKDSASPRLREIRRQLAPLREQIHERLYSIMDRQAGAIQERFITIRRDRFVIPVKASMQNQVPGIVLDQSDTGLTVFLEPAQVVPLNNKLYSLKLEEEAEVNRILLELSALLAQDLEIDNTLWAITQLDLARAAASLAEDWTLCKPELTENSTYQLENARHPLIQDCVANSLKLDAEHRLLLLTGPNMGGKTALLKTLGLAVLMAQCGLYVPASKAELSFPDKLYVDIGDEQSIQENLSTFAAHLLRLKEILQEAGANSLVLIDELGTGTDPEEGASLSQAFIERLLEKGVKGLISTHLSPLKAFAQEQAGVQNASMQFDVEKLRPLYKLSIGLPGKSYALSIAKRLGFPADVISRAGEVLGPQGGQVERLLAGLEAAREQLANERAKTTEARERAEAFEKDLRTRLSALEKERERVMAQAQEQAAALIEQAGERLRSLRERAKSEGQGKALEELAQLRSKYRKKARPQNPSPHFEAGALVKVAEYGKEARVLELRGEAALVQMGKVKMSLPLTSLEPLAKTKEASPGFTREKTDFDTELNLRGQMVEDALLELDHFLDEAVATGAGEVRLLHGKGTGALRNAIRSFLAKDRRVASFSDAVPYQGGHGVTVVTLRV